MELVFIRHAQPAWVSNGRTVPNPGLTVLGHRQAAEAAARISGDGRYDELLVSPLLRAVETAAPIAEATGLTPQIVEGIAEITGDAWKDTPIEELHRIFEAERRRPMEEWWDGFTGGETFHHFHDRIARAMDQILADRGLLGRPEAHLWDIPQDPGRVLIVAHGGSDAVAIGHLLGLEPTPWEWERFRSPHASISRVASTPLAGASILALTSFADVAHLGEVTY
ncbi:MAG: histidine phosphatase family protein [Actinobacteria bacterium]|nr:histidine phosphatase family protein [Actinomycetota bacterium]MBU1494447.1 histidine phosphatase family protein [Actinomycetota bacterium]MBU1865855.1 histidine phosphatase family protein [Actinomycetota bacterium]